MIEQAQYYVGYLGDDTMISVQLRKNIPTNLITKTLHIAITNDKVSKCCIYLDFHKLYPSKQNLLLEHLISANKIINPLSYKNSEENQNVYLLAS